MYTVVATTSPRSHCCVPALHAVQASAAAAPVAAQGHDSLLRSAAKGLIWRLFSTTATVGIALLVLHDILQVSHQAAAVACAMELPKGQ